jgi:hypothetical protein
MGGANGSRECAPDDERRDIHQLPFVASMGFAKSSTHPAPADPWSLVDGRRVDVGDTVKRHKPATRFACNWRKNAHNAAIGISTLPKIRYCSD